MSQVLSSIASHAAGRNLTRQAKCGLNLKSNFEVAGFTVDAGGFLFQLEPFPHPPRYAPQHLLHFSIESREADCRFIRSVAVGAAAVNHEGGAGRECGEVALDDSAVRQVDGSGNVAGGIIFRAADIQDDVIGLAGLQVLVDIPAVGFEFEQFFEVFEGSHGITFARLGGRCREAEMPICAKILPWRSAMRARLPPWRMTAWAHSSWESFPRCSGCRGRS